MNFTYFFVICLGIFALLHFLWIPVLERRFVMDRSAAAIGRAALLSVLGVLRSIFLISTLTSLLIIVIMLFLGMMGGASSEEVLKTIGTVKNWRSALVGFGPAWGTLVTLFLVLALVIHANRRSKRRMNREFQKAFDAEYQQMEKLYDQNKLEKIKPTREMKKIQEELNNIKNLLSRHEKIEPPEGYNHETFRQELLRHSHTLKEMLKVLDIQRRIDLKLDPSEVELPKAHTKWEKFQTFFISRGLLKNLNRSSRLVYILCFILLVPSLLGIYSGKIGNTLDKRVVELENLKLNLTINQVSTDLEKEKDKLGEAVNELNEEDEAVIDEAARVIEDTILDHHLQAVRVGARFALRSSIVRDEILNRAVKRSEGNFQKHASGSKVKSLTPLEREVLQVNESALKKNRQPTEIYRNLKKELKDVARRNPPFVEKLKSGLKDFKRTASARDISRSLISHISGNMVDGIGQSEIGRVVQQAVHGRKMPVQIKTLYETQGKRIVLNLSEGKSFIESLDAVKFSPEMAEVKPIMRTTLKDLPIEQINNKLRYYPPTVKSNVEPHVNLKKVTEEISSFRKTRIASGGIIRQNYSDAVAKFGDWFPGQLGSERNTLSSRMQSKWTGKPSTKIKPKLRGGTKFRFARARSFVRLRGFSRIGGVLIGRLSSKSSLNFTDIDWEIEDSKIRLILTRSDGQKFKSIPHRKSLIYYALNYAADGRPTTVTMATASPMIELKILLHPALEDTPMGYRIIELDRFVDTYTGDDVSRRNAQANIVSQNALYKLAWGNRVLALIEYLEKNNTDLPEDFLKIKNYVKAVVEDPETRLNASFSLLARDDLNNPTLSPLTVKKEFYDPTLVHLILKSAKEYNELDLFEKSIRQACFDRIVIDLSEELFERWLSAPPEFEVWSGVREKNFNANPSEFMILEDAEFPQPFDFMLQIAFTSNPGFLPEKQGNSDEEFYEDTKPWEFPALKKSIHEKVLKKVRYNSRDSVILSDAAEFTILQRFFRMAFNGRLGVDFPVEKLLDLVKIIENGVPRDKIRTLRWNARPGIVQLLEQSIDKENREEIMQLLRIRKELGIWKDEQQIIKERNAPLPALN